MIREATIELRVRYSETDAMGYVYHGNYLSFFEMGRTELLRAAGGSYRHMEEQGLFLVVTKANIQYRSPARYDDLLSITTRLDRVTFATLTHAYEIHRDGQLLTTADITLASVDRDGRIQRMSELFPDLFQS